MHYKTRANVYMVLGRGVVGVCYCSYLGGGGVSRVGKSSGCTRLRLWYAKLRFCKYKGYKGIPNTIVRLRQKL